MSQPPNQQHNPYGGPHHPPQQRGPAGGYNNPRPMGAWQPAAPTSLQMASQGQPQQPNPQQYGQQQQMGAGGYTVPPPQMNPYAYHNPYAQQYPQQRVGGWNAAYAGNMYGAPNPAMYYQQPGGPQSQPPPVQSVPQGTAVAAAAAVPAPRPKKALIITDKHGNPIDLSSVKKSSSNAPAPAPVAPTETSSTQSSDAGAKLRQAALERLRGVDATKKKQEEEAAASAIADAAAKKKADEEEAAQLKKEEEEKKEAEEKAKRKVAEEEEELAKEKELEEKAAKPKSSLSDMMSKLEVETKVVSDAPLAPDVVPASNGTKRRFVYSKEEMMRLKSLPVCIQRPDDLVEFIITKGPSRGGGGGGDRGGDRRQSRDGGGGGAGGGGGGGNWQRGTAAPRRSSTDTRDNKGAVGGGGGQWSRGQAPPPKPPQGQGPVQGRGGGRGGRGGRGSGPPFFDGPVTPLVKSSNGWRPVKNTSAVVVAEKQVRAILNKMTKEKFDRLAAQMCEIPVLSYEILTMMIGIVYEKAIDEPSFGDMYGDLCVKLSQQVQTDSFVQIIESDEEPPTEDGESSPEPPSGQVSANSVYRWSNDVSTADSEIVGPFLTPDECLDVALSDTDHERIDRGEIELELVQLKIRGGMFIKILKKKSTGEEEEGEENEFYTVYFPVANHDECGQQLSKIFLSERECMSDASKQNSFKRSLLNKCEDEFNKQDIYVDWKKEKAAYEESKSTLTDAERAEKEEELEFRRIKIKKQMLGNIKFIGQLYKKGLLKEKIMRYCISSLLKLETDDKDSKVPLYHDAGDGEMDEEDHEAICNMFETIGSTIDGPAVATFINVCFIKIKRLSTSDDLPSRSRFMYKDLLELRANNWVPRRKEQKAKTIEEIRKDFEREERMKQQESQQMDSKFRSGARNDFGRQDNRRPGNDFRTTNRASNFGTSAGARRQSKTVSETDDDGFTTIISGTSKVKSSLAQAAAGQSTAPRAPKIVAKQSSFAALAEDAPTQSKSTAGPLDDETFKRRVGTIRGEYMQDTSNVDELLLSVEELTGTPDYGMKFVQVNCDRVIDCKDDERASIYTLIGMLVQKGILTSDDVKTGMVDLIEFIDSFVCDAPRAFDYLGDMLSAMMKVQAVDIIYICEQAEKTRLSSEENPGKIIEALASSMKTLFGANEAKSMLSANVSALEALIGSDKWGAIDTTM